jgi:hypothetical protein
MEPKAVLNWFLKAGPGGAIFDLRPFVPGTSIFPTRQGGYSISFELSGIDPDGAARSELDSISRDYAEAINALPDRCVVYEYLVSRKRLPLDTERHADPRIAQQQQQRGRLFE